MAIRPSRKERKCLGLFWDNVSLSTVELQKGQPIQFGSIPLNLVTQTPLPSHTLVPEVMKLTSLLTKCLREKGIQAQNAFFALPTQDIIYRSFVIPWMHSHEVKHVVEFEANKYLPFNLQELSSTYQTETFKEDNKKRIRILFAAVRKEILEQYQNILGNANLQVALMEPSAISLVRLLGHHKLIPMDQTCALLEISHGEANIIIVDKGMTKFMREFHVAPSTEMLATEAEAKLIRLTSEIRVSLDYYVRQFGADNIERIYVLADKEATYITNQIKEEFEIPVMEINTRALFNQGVEDMGWLKAYGAALADYEHSGIYFDLTMGKKKFVSSRENLALLRRKYKRVAIVSATCLLLLGMTHLVTWGPLEKLRQDQATLLKELGPYQTMGVEEIETQKNTTANEFKAYQNIRSQSNTGIFLKTLPVLLPEGTWLNKLVIQFQGSQLAIHLDGYSYQEDPYQQNRLIHRFIENLKNQKDLSNEFHNIQLVSIKQQTLYNYPVTYFKISCQ